MLLVYKLIKKYRAYVAGFAILMLLSVATVNTELGSLLGANSLKIQSHPAFDGTVYPYAETVMWTELTDSEREMDFANIRASKTTTPYFYNEKNLGIDFKDLDFRDSKSDQIRNEKITYSVPYMGNYKLDGKAGAGSHAAVDIKLVMRTPLQSIANGVVYDTGDKPSGFGKYVVIKHENVPSVDNPNVLTTYYSSYSHMDDFSVSKGQIVRKGETIGFSGTTGTSTTPHLHFQIDKADAPFHPYWPFTWQEAEQAGLSFFEAINSGLGKENALKYTVNPMDFVQNNLDYSTGENFDDSEVKNNEVQNDEVVDLKPSEETIEIVVDDVNVVKTELSFEDFPKVVLLGEDVDLNVSLDSGFLLASNTNSQSVKIESNKRAEVSYPQNLTAGENNVSFKPREVGRYNLTVSMDGQEYVSPLIEVKLFEDISVDDVDLPRLAALKKAGILKGSDGSMNPEDNVSRAESLTFLVRTLNAAKPGFFDSVNKKELAFADIDEKAWYLDDLKLAAGIGSVDSSRENFEPGRSVLLPELLKMYFEAMGADINLDEVSESDYFDVNAWYAPYLSEALNRNIVNSSDLKDLGKPLSRREVANFAYKFLSLVETGRYTY